MLEDTLVKLGRGDSVYRGKSFGFGVFFFLPLQNWKER